MAGATKLNHDNFDLCVCAFHKYYKLMQAAK